MTELKIYEIGGYAININAISFIQDKGNSIIIHFIGGESITINTQLNSFLMAAKTVK